MKRFENQTFEYFEDWSTGRKFSDVEFVNCRFTRCSFSAINFDYKTKIDFVAFRSTARRVRFVNSVVDSVGFVGPGIVEDSTIDGLKVLNHIQSKGTVFKRVVVKGVVDKFMVTPYVDIFGDHPDVQKRFDEANSAYYKTVDWALDISEAQFKDCDIRGVPSSLIKRDPTTQAILTREKALEGKWREVDLSNTHWAVAIKLFLESGYHDSLLVAPRKARNFKALLEGINKLRDAGVLELD
jgi:hypothetical protein